MAPSSLQAFVYKASSDPLPITSVVAGGIACIFLWIAAHHYRVRNNTPLRHVPGPWLASCSILYRFYYAVIKGNWHNDLIALHHKYGPIVRIAPE